MNQNPLAAFYSRRDDIIEEVTRSTLLEALSREDGAALLDESLEQELKRLESTQDPLRDIVDKSFWEGVGAELHERTGNPRPLVERVIRYHAEEIAGNFDPKVYRMATVVVPNGFNWMLRTLDWKTLWNVFRSLMNEKIDLRRKVHLTGKTELIKKLAEKGTVVLVPTHFSNMDSVLMGWAVYELGLPPFCYGAGLNLFTNPMLGYFMNNLGAYKVDRRKKHRLYRWTLLNYSTVALEKGCHSLFFPAGGRSRSGAPEFAGGALKTGLLSTVQRAYIHNLQNKAAAPNLYVVPCVISYHVVLEAASLIEEHLVRSGVDPLTPEDDESFMPKTIAKFAYNFLRGSSSAYLNFCSPLDPFGNLVDEDGISRNRAGKELNLAEYVTSGGEIRSDPQRDREYALTLAEKILERYKDENLLLTSHFVAYVYFDFLLHQKAAGDIGKLLKTPAAACALAFDAFAAHAAPALKNLHALYDAQRIALEPALRSTDLHNIVEAATRNLGAYHTTRPLYLDAGKAPEAFLRTEDLKLLYYYHNRGILG